MTQSALQILLIVGLIGMGIFALLPFLTESKLLDFLSRAKNPVCQFLGLYNLRRAKRHRILLTMLNQRLRILSLLSVSFIFWACATASVTPSTRPAAESNAAVQHGLKATRDSIRDSQIHAAQGAGALEKADAGLTQLLRGAPTSAAESAPQPVVYAPSPSPTPPAKKYQWRPH